MRCVRYVLEFIAALKHHIKASPQYKVIVRQKWRSCVFLRVGMWCPLSSERFAVYAIIY